MKAIIVFAVLVALSTAYIVPSWSVYSAGDFKPTAVLAKSYSYVNETNTLNVCGAANRNIQVNSYSYQVGQGSVVWYSGTVNLPPQYVFDGGAFCFFYKLDVPVIARPGFTVYLTLNNATAGLGTVKVDFAV